MLPTVIGPLHRERAASAQQLEAGGKKAVAESRAEVVAFLRRLAAVRVLDPACGLGNFLYVTLEHLKRLEEEVLTVLGQLDQRGQPGAGRRPDGGAAPVAGLGK